MLYLLRPSSYAVAREYMKRGRSNSAVLPCQIASRRGTPSKHFICQPLFNFTRLIQHAPMLHLQIKMTRNRSRQSYGFPQLYLLGFAKQAVLVVSSTKNIVCG